MGLKPKDEVIVPVFTCTATTIPLIRRGVKVVFADIGENMLIDWNDAKKRITPKTRAIINIHLFDQLSPVRKVSVPIIGDAAQYLGKTSGEMFTVYSFQATKAITTVDGGILVCSKVKDYKRAKLLRWYGIDRETDKDNVDVDIFEAGFKYHMNNVTAAIGLASLSRLPQIKAQISGLQARYHKLLRNISGLKPIGGSPFLIHTKNREKLRAALHKKGIETGLGHKRNDIYTIFGGKRLELPNMNRFESTYLLLPCRMGMKISDVDFISREIKKEMLKGLQ
jgi:dTDP-4-amino-4,6-dideoxygalactose transaminase